MVRILNLGAIKNTILYLSRKRIELSLIIFIPVFLALFAFGSAYIVQDIILASLNKNIISQSEAASARGNVNIVLLVSTLTAIITGLILAYSILLPIKRILRSLAVSHQPSAGREVVLDNILGRDFGLMVTSLNKYVDILESMSGGIITVNSSGVVTTINPSAEMILGCKSEELIGKTIEEIPPLSPPLLRGELKGGDVGFSDFKKIVYDSLRDKRVCSSEEINIITKDNRRVSLGATTSLLKDREGAVTGIVVNFKDLSKIKKIHSQLQRADRLASLGGVAAGVAHEIRNPLGSIKGLAQLLSEELKGSERAKYVDTIISEVERLNIVVENLLTLSHPDKVSVRLCDINEILHNTVGLSKYYIGEKDIQILEEYDDTIPKIIVESERLYQAFLNILINAAQAIEKEGKISVRTKAGDGSISIELSNSNSYIRPEDMEHIFDPF
ncbi:MAG: histidine kinase dimerization/phospho-acceptor domain-containing protein, partial [Nitrospirota bacterium]